MNNQVQLVFIAVILYSSLSINHEGKHADENKKFKN